MATKKEPSFLEPQMNEEIKSVEQKLNQNQNDSPINKLEDLEAS